MFFQVFIDLFLTLPVSSEQECLLLWVSFVFVICLAEQEICAIPAVQLTDKKYRSEDVNLYETPANVLS